MIRIDWDPSPYVGPIPMNWYGISFVLAFLVGGILVRRWAPQFHIAIEHLEGLMV